MYVSHVLVSTENKGPNLVYYQLLQEFDNVLLVKVSGLPPIRDIDFTVNILLGATPVSKAPYRMSTLELVELNM